MKKEYKLPEILYKLLAEHNMTQQQLADKLVCGQNTIYKWLRKDIMPNLCFIMLMAEIFNVSTDYLIYGTESRWNMTDYEAFKWILNDSENIPKNFSNPERWERFERLHQRFNKVYPESPYCELLERLQRAFYETATIYYIINEKGGIENVEYYKQT